MFHSVSCKAASEKCEFEYQLLQTHTKARDLLATLASGAKPPKPLVICSVRPPKSPVLTPIPPRPRWVRLRGDA